MGQDTPLLLLVMLGAAGYMGKLWLDDYRAAQVGQPNPRALPGATPATTFAIVIAVVGSLLLLAAETAGEYALGISSEQSEITVLFGLYTLAAAFIEELIFRGYIVATKKGTAALVLSIVGASLVFALVHPFLWKWEDGALSFHFTSMKAWFSTGAIFLGSLWFYAVRFLPFNPTHSLIPCVAAHAAKNLGVFAIKYAQGFVSGWW
jgi:membrane protease YdiL (CAAX protease family)